LISPGQDAGPPSVLSQHAFTGLTAATREEAFAELARRLAEAGAIRDPETVARKLSERERLGSTALGSGVAIPHLKISGLADAVVAVGAFPGGVEFGAPDGVPVKLIFLVLSPADSPALHLQILARISRLLRLPGVADNLQRASSPEQIREALEEAQASKEGGRT
jgi:mannitol/fructose-specific phosphotransferase system IIA component (Ntr-type)